MELKDIAVIVQDKQPGSFATLVTRKDCVSDFNKTARGDRSRRFPFTTLEKRSRFQMRLGHEYENQKSTIEARENGMGHKENDYAVRMDGDMGKFFAVNIHNGKTYLCGQPCGLRETEYFHNGEKIDSAILADFRKPKQDKPLHMRVSTESIQSIVG